MAYAYLKVSYAGTNVFNLPFSYLNASDIYLYVNGTERPQSEITFTSASVVTITTAGLVTGDSILIARVTALNGMLVVYSNDTQLTKTNLNKANTQLLYNNQETRDYIDLVTITTLDAANTAASAASASAVSASDSADDAAADALIASNASTAAQGYATSAENSKDAAYDSELAAAASEDNAAISDGNAEVYKNQAISSASTASTKATEAAASAAAALVSELASAASETAAGISETNAGVSEDNAAQSAIDAAASAASVDLSGIFTYIKTVDGTGSGLDADLLDGNHATAFATAAQGATADAALPAASYTASDVLTKIKTVDGSGSGLDADLLDGNEATAFATSGHTHTVYQNKIPAGTCATAIGTAAKDVTITGYTPAVGDVIAITFTSGNSAAAMTLNINSIGAYAIRMNNIATTTAFATLAAGAIILLYWDGTYFQMLGSQDTVDADLTDRMLWSNEVTAGITLYRYKLMMQGSDGKFYPLTLETGTGTTKTVSTVEFNIESPVLYYNSTTTVATNAAAAGVAYSACPITFLTYTFNQATWTAQLPIYLKGTITAAGRFKLDNTSYTSWATQTLPTTEDGFVYMLLGHMYSTTGMRLLESHPLIEYKGSKLRTYIADGVASGLNADKLDGYHIDDIATYVAGAFAPASHVSDTAAPHGAVSTNTASKIVTRDASGNFAAGTITANLTGTAISSTYALQLVNTRTLNVSGAVTGTAQNFDGTANVIIPTALDSTALATKIAAIAAPTSNMSVSKVGATTQYLTASAINFQRVGVSGSNVLITATNGSTILNFSTAVRDPFSCTTANTFTAPYNGMYMFNILVFVTDATTAIGSTATLMVGGGTDYRLEAVLPNATLTTDYFSQSFTQIMYLTAGQTVVNYFEKWGGGQCTTAMDRSRWAGVCLSLE